MCGWRWGGTHQTRRRSSSLRAAPCCTCGAVQLSAACQPCQLACAQDVRRNRGSRPVHSQFTPPRTLHSPPNVQAACLERRRRMAAAWRSCRQPWTVRGAGSPHNEAAVCMEPRKGATGCPSRSRCAWGGAYALAQAGSHAACPLPSLSRCALVGCSITCPAPHPPTCPCLLQRSWRRLLGTPCWRSATPC